MTNNVAEKLAASFAMPSKNSTSPQGNIADAAAIINDPDFPQTLKAYLAMPENTIPGKPCAGLVMGLMRALNVGQKELVSQAYQGISWVSTLDSYDNPHSIYKVAETAIENTDIPQRLQYATDGAPILESIKGAAEGSGQTPIMPSPEALVPMVRTWLENTENAKSFGGSLKILAQSKNPELVAYAQKMKEAAACVIAKDNESLVACSSKELKIPHAGSIKLFTGPTADNITTKVEQPYFNEHVLPVEEQHNQKYFKFEATLWVESNALAGGVFADQAELDAAVEAAKKPAKAASAFDLPNLPTLSLLPADTQVNPNVTAKRPPVAGARNVN